MVVKKRGNSIYDFYVWLACDSFSYSISSGSKIGIKDTLQKEISIPLHIADKI